MATVTIAVVAAIALVIGLVGAFNIVLGIIFAMFGAPLTAAILLIASGVLLVRGVRQAIDADAYADRTVLLLAGPALLAGGGVAALAAFLAGAHLGDLGRLATEHGRYEAIIAGVRAADGAELRGEHDGIRYRVDPGPPLRVAFNPEGAGDNWSGTVFDPSGEVMLAEGFDPETGALVTSERIKKLFGGDLVGCSHLWGDYYSCSFT